DDDLDRVGAPPGGTDRRVQGGHVAAAVLGDAEPTRGALPPSMGTTVPSEQGDHLIRRIGRMGVEVRRVDGRSRLVVPTPGALEDAADLVDPRWGIGLDQRVAHVL